MNRLKVTLFIQYLGTKNNSRYGIELQEIYRGQVQNCSFNIHFLTIIIIISVYQVQGSNYNIIITIISPGE